MNAKRQDVMLVNATDETIDSGEVRQVEVKTAAIGY